MSHTQHSTKDRPSEKPLIKASPSTQNGTQQEDQTSIGVLQRKWKHTIDTSPRNQEFGAYQKMADSSPRVQRTTQLQARANSYTNQQAQPIQKKENNTGLPDQLKTGIEHLSGYSMDDVKVHFNSSKPAQLQAHAYAQGTDIHLAPGQERHLPHEAWHVVQQKQGRVKPTMQLKGKVDVNDDAGLEREADVMGEKVMRSNFATSPLNSTRYYVGKTKIIRPLIQRRTINLIKSDITGLLNEVYHTNYINKGAEVRTITRRQALMSGYKNRYQTLTREAKAKGEEKGLSTNLTKLSYLDLRVFHVNTRIATLTQEINSATGPKIEKSKSVWGGNKGKYEAYTKNVKGLKDNRLEKNSLTTEKASLLKDRPIVELRDLIGQIRTALIGLSRNLKTAEKHRYFYLLMTTRVPSMTSYNLEPGTWGDGKSTLGIFKFNGPDSIRGISRQNPLPVEVHIHFKAGSKNVQRAHIKQVNGWPYTILRDTTKGFNGPWYANTTINACKGKIKFDEII